MNLRRTLAMARKEILHIVRDPRSLIAAFTQPLLMLLIFGYALSLDVDRIPTVVYDLDQTTISDALIKSFRGSRYFNIVEEAHAYSPVDNAIDTRRALLAVVIPTDYSRNLQEGREAQVQLLLDGSDSNTAAIAQGYAEGLIQAFAQQAREDAQSTRTGSVVHVPVEARIRVWYNTDLVSRDFIVPGLIGVIIMIIASLLTSLTVAREWENGTMEQLLSTPVRPVEIAMGKLAAYFLLGLADMAVSLAVAIFVFNVPLKGNPMLLFVSSCVFIFGALGWGIFISASQRNQLAAYQLGTLTSFLPAFLLSGFIYSIDSMPAIIRGLALFVPARYYIEIIKGVFLKGTGLKILWFNLVLLTAYGGLVFYWATSKLKKKVA